MFKNMKLGLRLGIGFGMMIVLMSILVLFGVTRIAKLDGNIEKVVGDRMVKTRQANAVLDDVAITGLAMRNIFLHADAAKVEMEMERNKVAGAAIRALLDSLDKSVNSPEGRQRLDGVEKARKAYVESRDQMLEMFKAGKVDTAKTMMMGEVREAYNEYLKSLKEFIDFQTDLADKDGDDTAAIAQSTQQMLVILALIALVLGIFAAVVITKSITSPINEAIQIADKVAAGDASVKVVVDSSDETGMLKQAMKNMVDTLNALVSQMKSMSDDHTRGEIDTQIDASKFQGAFADMGRGINEMVFGHIAVMKKAMACVGEFGRGNFDAPLEKFPGKKAFINDTIEKVRENLKTVNEDTIMLVKAALEGRLATRADATKHQGDFRKIIQGINDTLDAVINPVNEAAQVLEKVAARDMTVRVMGNYQGDLGRIKIAVNTAVDNLDKALGQVSQATLQVSSAAQQISAGSQSLAQGANEQASSLEEVSSSLEEMASMTRQNADNALQAKNLAGEADGNAKQGSEAMSRMDTAIVKIKDSSDQTAKIVKTIDEIAMQTNLLALNAAVEAARAGEAGRGFAVVAEEVRNLAQRSAQAAKSTADMIGESVKNADEGVKIAREVAKSFESIAVSSRKVNDLIAEIASASKEQSQGIEQVNAAVSQMDKVTQQTAANAEESASSSEELSSQAEELQSMVGQFQITQEIGASRAAPALAGTRRPALPPPARKNAAPPPAKRNRSVNPDDVIPMDDLALREF
jgi:methyl-accepting chemotaxis protein